MAARGRTRDVPLPVVIAGNDVPGNPRKTVVRVIDVGPAMCAARRRGGISPHRSTTGRRARRRECDACARQPRRTTSAGTGTGRCSPPRHLQARRRVTSRSHSRRTAGGIRANGALGSFYCKNATVQRCGRALDPSLVEVVPRADHKLRMHHERSLRHSSRALRLGDCRHRPVVLTAPVPNHKEGELRRRRSRWPMRRWPRGSLRRRARHDCPRSKRGRSRWPTDSVIERYLRFSESESDIESVE